jgi:hypothetical protein
MRRKEVASEAAAAAIVTGFKVSCVTLYFFSVVFIGISLSTN